MYFTFIRSITLFLKVSVRQYIPFICLSTFLCKDNFCSKELSTHQVKMNCTMSISPYYYSPCNSTWTCIISTENCLVSGVGLNRSYISTYQPSYSNLTYSDFFAFMPYVKLNLVFSMIWPKNRLNRF